MNKIFYQIRTGFLFFIFGFICLSGNLFFVPIKILNLNHFKIVENFARDLIYFSWGFFIFLCKITGYLSFEFEKFQPKKGTLIIANHPSLLDIVFMISKFKRANCVIKNKISKNIFLFAAAGCANYILNDENFLEKSIKVLKNGEILIIFPEGTRSKNEIIFHKSASYIAINGAKFLELMFINMSPKSLQKNTPWYKTPNQTIKYNFSHIKNLEISDFFANISRQMRVIKLHKALQNIYNKGNQNDRRD